MKVKEQTKVMSVRVPLDVYESIKYLCLRNGQSMSSVVGEMVTFGVRTALTDDMKKVIDEAVKIWGNKDEQ